MFEKIGLLLMDKRMDIGLGEMDKVVEGIGIIKNKGEMRVIWIKRVDWLKMKGELI